MGGRGRRHSQEERRLNLELVNQAITAGARQARACEVIGISARTLQRWMKTKESGDQRRGPKRSPAHKLTSVEESEILAAANSPELRNLSPEQVIAALADQGRYICSESSLRRILKRHKQAAHRRRSKAPKRSEKPRTFVANEPLRLLSWDITYLRSARVRGLFFYLYLFIDIWSRRVVGWEVYERESSQLAAQAFRRVCVVNGIETIDVVLHADNGSPMKGSTMLATLEALGVTHSFSRPRVSNDNAHVESFFRHLKYAPNYPTEGFNSLADARQWVCDFVNWYNTHHRHSRIGYVTPDERHSGLDHQLLRDRRDLYEQARRRNPRRWTGATRPWLRPTAVVLNPERLVVLSPDKIVAAA